MVATSRCIPITNPAHAAGGQCPLSVDILGPWSAELTHRATQAQVHRRFTQGSVLVTCCLAGTIPTGVCPAGLFGLLCLLELCFPGNGAGNCWKVLCTHGKKRGSQVGSALCCRGKSRYKAGSLAPELTKPGVPHPMPTWELLPQPVCTYEHPGH